MRIDRRVVIGHVDCDVITSKGFYTGPHIDGACADGDLVYEKRICQLAASDVCYDVHRDDMRYIADVCKNGAASEPRKFWRQ